MTELNMTRTAFALLLLVSLGTFARGDDPPPVYQPAGAPADPRVPAQWNRYHDYAQSTALLEQLSKTFPDLCRLTSLGRSYGKREMWVLEMTNPKRGAGTEKPAFWIDGGIHANEIQGTEVVLYTAWYLAETYGHNPLITRLLDERTIYLMPMMSPDSRDAHMYRPNSTHSPRGGQRPVDDDRDGLVDEDKADDLDGDGQITQMRIADPNGRWKQHADYPELMIACKPDEVGQYTLLDTEGFDNDGDGKVDEDADGYYDPNRNWPWSWQPNNVQHGADRYPFSVPEVRLVADFIMAHPNIAGAQSYHNSGGMILRGPGVKAEHYDQADLAVYNEFGRKGELLLPGYKYMEASTELYELFGGEFDWLYNMQGVFAFTNELFTPFNFFRHKAEGVGFGKPEEQRQFEKYLLLSDGVVPWHAVDHPQYGKIEVGGLKKNWLRQPPSFLLEEECHRNMAFTLFHADQMPQVAVDSIVVKPLTDNLFEVTATIVNRKLTPTRSAVDVKNKLSPPDRISLEGQGVQVVAGLVADNLLFENPREQKRSPATLRVDTIPGMKPVYVRWVVSGRGPYTVRAQTAKGGAAERASAAE
jgi:murein tripeptide amidase MpaA